VPNGFGEPRGVPEPSTNFEGIPAPETSIIVKFDGTHWVDELGRPYDDSLKFSLPDKDVFVIDAMAHPPAPVAASQRASTGVGTPNAEDATSLALPLGMAITPDGTTLYVAAMGSSKIGVYSTAALESDTFVPSTANQIPVSGGGPTGLALDAGTHRLYALTRF